MAWNTHSHSFGTTESKYLGLHSECCCHKSPSKMTEASSTVNHPQMLWICLMVYLMHGSCSFTKIMTRKIRLERGRWKVIIAPLGFPETAWQTLQLQSIIRIISTYGDFHSHPFYIAIPLWTAGTSTVCQHETTFSHSRELDQSDTWIEWELCSPRQVR